MRDLSMFASPGGAMPYIITIQQALKTIRWTTWSHALTVGGDVYEPGAGATVTDIQTNGDGSAADNCDLTIMTSAAGDIKPGDAAAGFLDFWPVTVSLVNPFAPDSGVCDVIAGGITGSATEDSDGLVTIAANGQWRQAQEQALCEHFSLTGREDLGDDRCKVPLCASPDIGAFDVVAGQAYQTIDGDSDYGLQRVADCFARARKTVTGTVEDYANLYLECTTAGTPDGTGDYSAMSEGDVITDGDAQFTVRNAWLRHARGRAVDPYTIVLAASPDPRSDADETWYVNGGLFVRSGTLSGYRAFPIASWDPGELTIKLCLAVDVDAIPDDTELEIHPGCDQTAEQCNTRFDNIKNLRAENLVPPDDLSLTLSAF